MNLPELYVNVCAKVPGAKAAERTCGFRKPLNLLHMNERWWWTNEHGEGRCVYDDDAEAIILKHWLSLVSSGDDLCRRERKWRMFDCGGDVVYPIADTPIEAIAAYLLIQAG